MNSPGKPTFAIKTLGCKVNQYESQAMRESLLKSGFAESEEGVPADFYLINSCTVTHKADKDTRNLIRHFHKINPQAKIVVAGCYAELEGDRQKLRALPGVEYLIRNREKGTIADVLMTNDKIQMTNEFQISNFKFPITGFKDRDRAFVKVQDGCNHRCSYCKVSIVRGPSRSRDTGGILGEVRPLVEAGFKEIVLTGVCLGAWGKDLDKKANLAGLVNEISHIDGKFRIRLSSIEPLYITDELINVLKENKKLCKHLHIPLQSGDDKVLKAMNRPYTTRKFNRIVKKIRKFVPDVAIATDVLLGFPTEDEKSFERTQNFVREMKPSRIHVFSYSKREGTAAAKKKYDPDKETIKNRVKTLRDLAGILSTEFARGFIGKKEDAIIEGYRDRATGLLTGYTDRYIRVLLEGPDSAKNKILPIRITKVIPGKNAVSGCLDNMQII